jgi:hypothetical protein
LGYQAKKLNHSFWKKIEKKSQLTETVAVPCQN